MDQRQPGEELDLDEVRRALEERLAGLRSRERELKRPPERGADISFGKRIGEGTNEAIGRLTDVGVAEGLEHLEARVVRALEKLDEGTYGICDSCGEPIPAPRLRFAPESALCVTCAKRRP
jgi:DnaK suppressor protein